MSKNVNHECLEQLLKRGLGECIDNMPDSDTEQAWLQFNKKYKKRHSIKFSYLAASLAIILLLSSVLFPGASQAFRGFLQRNIVQKISETVDLYQQGDVINEDHEYILSQPDEQAYSSYQDLLAADLERIFIPGEHIAAQFLYATIASESDTIYKATMDFLFDGTIVQLIQQPKYAQISSAKAIDNEDYRDDLVNIGGIDVAVFSHLSGLISLQWEHNNILFRLEANTTAEEIFKFAEKLELF